MSKKHFIALADILKEIQPLLSDAAFTILLMKMCQFCRAHSNTFDENRFRKYVLDLPGPSLVDNK